MFFIETSKPNTYRHLYYLLKVKFLTYLLMYIFFPRVAHRMVHYFLEEEAVFSYTVVSNSVESGEVENECVLTTIDAYVI